MSIWISCLLAPPGDLGGDDGPGGGGFGEPPGCDCNCLPDGCGGGCDEVIAYWCNEKNGGACESSSIPGGNIPGFNEDTCEPPEKFVIDDQEWWSDGKKCDQYCGYICRRWLCESPFPQDQPCAWFDFIIFDLEECGAFPDIPNCGVTCVINGITYYTDALECKLKEKNCNQSKGGGDGFSIWWVCSGKPKWQCDEILVFGNDPPPPGAWKSLTACEENCTTVGGPGTPGPTGPSPPGPGDIGPTSPPPPTPGAPGPGQVPPIGYECGEMHGGIGSCICCDQTCQAEWDVEDQEWVWADNCNPDYDECQSTCLGKTCPICSTGGICEWGTTTECDVYCDKSCPVGDTIEECEVNCGKCDYTCWDCVYQPFNFETGEGGVDACTPVTIRDECDKTLESVCLPNFLYTSLDKCKDGGCGDDALSNDTGYNNSQKDRVYSMTYVDEVFERNHSNKTYKYANAEFLPINRGTLPASLFKTTVHTSVRAVYDLNNKGMLFSDIPYSDLEDDDIENSLHINIVNLLNKAKLATGQSIKSQVLGAIRGLLISNRIHTLVGDDLIILLKRIIRNQTKYPDTRLSETKSLSLAVNEAKAIKLAGDNAFRLKGNVYSDGTNERMKYWKTLATDLDKNLPITLSHGTKTQLYYKINDTIPLNSGGSITMSEGDYQRITTHEGSYIEIPVQGDFDRARILQLETLQKIMYLLDETYDFTLNVSSAPDLYLDERYGVTEERENFYMLTANLSSVTDLERENSFISKTQVTYTYETDSTIRDDWVSKFPFPFMVFMVDADDPIFTYITNGGIVNLTTKDFVFDIFDDPRIIRPIRRFLPTVVLIPTDKTKDVPFHTLSKYVSYGVRELIFEVHPDPDKSDVWEAPHIKESFAYPKPGISTAYPTHNAKKYGINTEKLDNLINYTNITPVLPRPKGPTRRLFEVLKDFKINWEISGNTVKWSDVYDNMDREQIKFLHRECSDLEGFKSLASMGKIHKDVEDIYPKVKEVRSDMKPITFDFFKDNPKLVKKPNITNPPDPIT